VRDFDAGPVLEQFAGEMRDRADARRRPTQRAGIGLGVSNKFLKRVERRRVWHDDDVGIGANEGHCREIGCGVEGQRGKQQGLNQGRSRGEQHRVAIGGRVCDGVERDPRPGSRPVLHDDLLMPDL
jgi:hypothetical protein